MTGNRWTYSKDGGEAYPVKDGTVWQVGDRHTFVCSDLVESRLFDQVAAGSFRPTLLYCDPPWNTGNLSTFRRKASKPRQGYELSDLIQRVLSFGEKIPAFVEGGVKEEEWVKALMPGPVVRTYRVTYYKRHPSLVFYTGPTHPLVDLTGLDDEDTPLTVLQAYRTGVVIDPCAGRGLTARSAHHAAWRSLTNEMSPWRMAAAMHSVSALVGVTPIRIQ